MVERTAPIVISGPGAALQGTIGLFTMSLESSVDSSLQVPHRAIELYYGLQALHTAAPARAGREEKWLRTGHGVLAHWRRENSDAYRKGKTGPGFDPLEKVPN